MPTKRTRVARVYRSAVPADLERHLLTGRSDLTFRLLGRVSVVGSQDDAQAFLGLRDAWVRHAADLLGSWVTQNPGTRPFAWWRVAAPRDPASAICSAFPDRLLAPDPRRRVAGTGRATTSFGEYGIPGCWEDVDETDPPAIESEAAYLARHKLFLRGERSRLTKADFAPVSIELQCDDAVPTREGPRTLWFTLDEDLDDTKHPARGGA